MSTALRSSSAWPRRTPRSGRTRRAPAPGQRHRRHHAAPRLRQHDPAESLPRLQPSDNATCSQRGSIWSKVAHRPHGESAGHGKLRQHHGWHLVHDLGHPGERRKLEQDQQAQPTTSGGRTMGMSSIASTSRRPKNRAATSDSPAARDEPTHGRQRAGNEAQPDRVPDLPVRQRRHDRIVRQDGQCGPGCPCRACPRFALPMYVASAISIDRISRTPLGPRRITASRRVDDAASEMATARAERGGAGSASRGAEWSCVLHGPSASAGPGL